MHVYEKDIITEAVRRNREGEGKDFSYGWAKRVHWDYYGWMPRHRDYQAFIRALSAALDR